MSESTTLPTKEFLDVLSFARGFTTDKGLVPALRYLYFSGRNLTAFNGVSGIACSLPWEVPRFALPADRLVTLVSSLAAQNIETLTLSVADSRVMIHGGTFSGWLAVPVETLAKEMFHRQDRASRVLFPLPAGWGVDLERVEWGLGEDETRPRLQGVHWAPSGALISSDGIRATALRPTTDSPRCPLPEGMMIPAHVLSRLGARRHEISGIEADGNGVTIALPDAFLYGREIEGGFPAAALASAFQEAWARLAGTAGTWVQISPDEPTAHILERIGLFAPPPLSSLEVLIEPGGLRLLASSPETSGEEGLRARVAGPGGSFRVNGRYFGEALARASSFWYGGPETPLYFLSDDRRLEHLLLPLRAS